MTTEPVGRPFLLSKVQLRNSLQVDASEAVMRRVWTRLQSGAPLRIGVLGSSVAMSGGCQKQYQPQLRCAQFDGIQVQKRFSRGYGVVDDVMRGLLHNADRPVRGFVLQMLDWINATWPNPSHRIENAAVDAWTAKAFEPCLLSNERLTHADLLLLELGSQGWHSSQAAASERVIRKLLQVTSAEGDGPPAMIMVTTRQWCGRSVHGLRRNERPVILRTREGIEDIFARFCVSYGLACLSLRDAIFDDVVAGHPNFTVPDVAADCLHPEQSRFGYHYMADMIIHFLQRSWAKFGQGPNNAINERRAARAPPLLPPAIMADNQGSAGRMSWRCYELSNSPTASASTSSRFIRTLLASQPAKSASRLLLHWTSFGGDDGAKPTSDGPACDLLRRCVLKAMVGRNAACLRGRGHWQHCTRTLAPRAAYKPGIVSLLPGAELRFVVDAQAPIAAPLANFSLQSSRSAILALTYLTSYQSMGLANVTCEAGCWCNTHMLDALQGVQPSGTNVVGKRRSKRSLGRNVSIAAVAEIPVRMASKECMIKIANVPRHVSFTRFTPLAISKWKLLQVRVGWEF